MGSSSNFAPVCLPGRDPTVVAAVKQLNQTKQEAMLLRCNYSQLNRLLTKTNLEN